MDKVELKVAYANLQQFFTQQEQDAEQKQKEADAAYNTDQS